VIAVLIFAVALVAGLLVSEFAERSVLSTAVFFLAAGVIAGRTGFGWIALSPQDPTVSRIAELALFTVLFTDGMRIGARDLASAWRLPGRALFLGLPLTAFFMAVFARFVVQMPWEHAFLLAAVLVPTDPVFAAAIVGREEIPGRLRQLLNVESGLNDGLALPFVVALVATIASGPGADYGRIAEDLALGAIAGVGIPWVALRIESLRIFAVARDLRPLFIFAIGLLVLGVGSVLRMNEFIAAFTAGVTVATIAPGARDDFHRFGELIVELLKLLALLVFGSLLSLDMFESVGWAGIAFALLAIFIARPAALEIVLLGSALDRRERVTVSWFGPKGFASVVYGIYVLNSGIPRAVAMFLIIAVAVAISIVLHSSTDVPIARWFRRQEEGEE